LAVKPGVWSEGTNIWAFPHSKMGVMTLKKKDMMYRS